VVHVLVTIRPVHSDSPLDSEEQSRIGLFGSRHYVVRPPASEIKQSIEPPEIASEPEILQPSPVKHSTPDTVESSTPPPDFEPLRLTQVVEPPKTEQPVPPISKIPRRKISYIPLFIIFCLVCIILFLIPCKSKIVTSSSSIEKINPDQLPYLTIPRLGEALSPTLERSENRVVQEEEEPITVKHTRKSIPKKKLDDDSEHVAEPYPTEPKQVIPPSPIPERPVLRLPSPLPPDTVSALKGDALLAAGDLAAARLAYEDAARLGSSEAALHLGMSYNPDVLARAGYDRRDGHQPAELYWYRKARDLGHPDANVLLRGMPNSAAYPAPPNRPIHPRPQQIVVPPPLPPVISTFGENHVWPK
jgi:hypothetical protein